MLLKSHTEVHREARHAKVKYRLRGRIECSG